MPVCLVKWRIFEPEETLDVEFAPLKESVLRIYKVKLWFGFQFRVAPTSSSGAKGIARGRPEVCTAPAARQWPSRRSTPAPGTSRCRVSSEGGIEMFGGAWAHFKIACACVSIQGQPDHAAPARSSGAAGLPRLLRNQAELDARRRGMHIEQVRGAPICLPSRKVTGSFPSQNAPKHIAVSPVLTRDCRITRISPNFSYLIGHFSLIFSEKKVYLLFFRS